MIRIFVFDTNSLISANLLFNSTNRQAYNKAREIGLIVHSDATLSEFIGTFIRPKFDKYLSSERRLEEVAIFERETKYVKVFKKIDICRDPKDNKFLELAHEAGATCIVTGDKDLLVLHPFNGIQILTASEFLNIFGG